MVNEIIMPLKRNFQSDGIIPSLECWLQPGVRVILLVPRPFDIWEWWKDHFINTDSVGVALRAAEELSVKYSIDAEKRLAEHRLFSVKEALMKRGVEVCVDLYTGSWRRCLKERAEGCARSWVIYFFARNRSPARVITGKWFGLGFLKRYGSQPGLLLLTN